MQSSNIKWLVVALTFNHFILEIHSFDYQNFNQWIVEAPQCGGIRQSPIDINLGEAIPDPELSCLKFNNYNQIPKSMAIRNNGHTVAITAEWYKTRPTISGGPLQGQYFLDSMHFHWSESNAAGSEHTVNNKSFPLELHLVHVNSKYESISVAMNEDDGLSVIGILFEVDLLDGLALGSMMSGISRARAINANSFVTPFSMAVFRLPEVTQFYTYLGSLTTPPCSESVTWLVSGTPRKVTDLQMQIFRRVGLSFGDKKNFRPVQPLNHRYVKTISCN